MGYMQAASTYINLTKRVESIETEESLARSLWFGELVRETTQNPDVTLE